MIESDKQRFEKCIHRAANILQMRSGRKVDDDLMRSYWSVLEPFTIDAVLQGFKAYVESDEEGKGVFFPTPSQVIKEIRKNLGAKSKSSIPIDNIPIPIRMALLERCANGMPIAEDLEKLEAKFA